MKLLQIVFDKDGEMAEGDKCISFIRIHRIVLRSTLLSSFFIHNRHTWRLHSSAKNVVPTDDCCCAAQVRRHRYLYHPS